MGKVTIQDIADRAGVSRGTVDRVLHNRPNVSPEIYNRVLELIKSTGYGKHALRLQEPERHIMVLLPGSGWFDADLKREWLRGVEDARLLIEPHGFVVEISECETDLPEEMLERIQLRQKQGMDGLVISARNIPATQNAIDHLAESGIPVLTYNSDIPGSKRICFIGQDYYRSGQVAGNLIGKYIGASDDILVVAGNLEIDAHRKRVDGFYQYFEHTGRPLARVQVVESYNDYILTHKLVTDFFKKNSRCRAVYMANESVAACAQSVDECGYSQRAMIVGNDLTAVTRRLLKNGSVDFIIEQNIYWQGYRPLMLLHNFILNHEEPKPFEALPLQIICSENMDF